MSTPGKVTSLSVVAAAEACDAFSVPLALESRQLDQAATARRSVSRLANRETVPNALDV